MASTADAGGRAVEAEHDEAGEGEHGAAEGGGAERGEDGEEGGHVDIVHDVSDARIRPMRPDDVAAAERLSSEGFFELDSRLAPAGRSRPRAALAGAG